MSKAKLKLAKMLNIQFAAVGSDKGPLHFDGDVLESGMSVYQLDEQGDLQPADDGEYLLDDGRVAVVVNGSVSEIQSDGGAAETEMETDITEPEKIPEDEEVTPEDFNDLVEVVRELVAEVEELSDDVDKLEDNFVKTNAELTKTKAELSKVKSDFAKAVSGRGEPAEGRDAKPANYQKQETGLPEKKRKAAEFFKEK